MLPESGRGVPLLRLGRIDLLLMRHTPNTQTIGATTAWGQSVCQIFLIFPTPDRHWQNGRGQKQWDVFFGIA